MALGSLVVAVLAVLVSVATYLDSQRKVRLANEAAVASAEAAKRSAIAAERQVMLAEAEAAKYRPPWKLETRDVADRAAIDQCW